MKTNSFNLKQFIGGIAFLTILPLSTFAQYETYPSLFGRNTYNGGTARYAAIGGAGTSLGADFGSSYVNPAGLGMYRKSEFVFTPDFGFAGSNSTFIDEDETERNKKGSFGISSFGVALCGNKDELNKDNWRGGTFSIGLTRTNSFHNRISFTGVDDKNSMADYFVERANGNSAEDYDYYNNPNDPNSDGIQDLGGLAYYAYLAEPTTSNVSQYYHGITDETVQKEATYTTKGSQNQWNIAYGGNYKDKLYIGGGLGITSLNFREDLSYTESVGYKVGGVFQYSPDTIDYFTFNDYNKIKGTGVNFKFGYIYKISDMLRIGSTLTTPTYYWMNQEYSSDLTVLYADNYIYLGSTLGEQSYATETRYFKFNYTTPLKVATGVSLFAGKAGFISGDIEYVPYQLSDLSGRNSQDDRYLKVYNKLISNTYTNVLNMRLGGELRMDIFKLRGGFAYLPNPYKYSDGINRNVTQISGGVGVRIEDVYFDLGIVNSRFQSSYKPYSLSYENTTSAVTKNSLVNVLLTVGFYFE